MNKKINEKTGLCFSGGGAKGAYQIGAAKALDELGILSQVDVFSGTSIGSVNLGLILSQGVDQTRSLWIKMSEEAPMKFSKDIKNVWKLTEGLFSLKKLEQEIAKSLDYNRLKKTDFYITVSNCGNPEKGFFEIFKTRVDSYFKKTDYASYYSSKMLDKEALKKTIVASCSIPIFFSPVTINGKKCYDGGVFDNAPLKPLIENGCDEIILIHLYKRYSLKYKRNNKDITLHEIYPKNRRMGNVLRFDKNKINTLYDWGYEDTMNYFKGKLCNKKRE